MGDARRFDLFARLIHESFPDKSIRIADVAGGKGYLQAALRQNGYRSVISFDRRKRNAAPHRQHFMRYQWFNCDSPESFDLVVGMHPDEGTDHIIKYAGKNGVPFAVCPCCVRPSATAFWGKASYPKWIDHLLCVASEKSVTFLETLKMNGRNDVIIGRPKPA